MQRIMQATLFGSPLQVARRRRQFPKNETRRKQKPHIQKSRFAGNDRVGRRMAMPNAASRSNATTRSGSEGPRASRKNAKIAAKVNSGKINIL